MRILLAQADLARPILAQELTAAGANVTTVAAYRTVLGSGGADVVALLEGRKVDAAIFTSSSTVHNFLRRLTAEGGHPTLLAGICLACLGPVTAQTARDLGLTVAVAPAHHTLEGLVEALEAYFKGEMRSIQTS
jgi:uroporphyrinogen III methyltransferase/synthase